MISSSYNVIQSEAKDLVYMHYVFEILPPFSHPSDNKKSFLFTKKIKIDLIVAYIHKRASRRNTYILS